jgi:hypothetical protein
LHGHKLDGTVGWEFRFIREVCSCHSNLPGFRHWECPDPKPRLEGKKLHHTLTALKGNSSWDSSSCVTQPDRTSRKAA